MKQYIFNLLIGMDQALNVILAGEPDETLSARAYRADMDNKIFGRLFRPLIDLLFWFEPCHCLSAYKSEISRKQLGKHYK